MPVAFAEYNIFDADTHAITIPVNTQGVLGKGLALQLKQTLPECVQPYVLACKSGSLKVGKCLVIQRGPAVPTFVVCFPTKTTWRNPSQLDYVKAGLLDLVKQVRKFHIASIAIPQLGCGLGGLAWENVRPLILNAANAMPDVNTVILGPK